MAWEKPDWLKTRAEKNMDATCNLLVAGVGLVIALKKRQEDDERRELENERMRLENELLRKKLKE